MVNDNISLFREVLLLNLRLKKILNEDREVVGNPLLLMLMRILIDIEQVHSA